MMLTSAGSAPARGRSPATGGGSFVFFPRPHDHGQGSYASASVNSYSGYVELGAGPAESLFYGASIRPTVDQTAVAVIEFATGPAGAEAIFASVPFAVWASYHSIQLLLPVPVTVGANRVSFRLMAANQGNVNAYVRGLFMQTSPSHIEPWRV